MRCAPRSARRTKVLWCETPSNPLLKITDIAALAEIGARRRRAGRRRQHLRLALPAAPAGARRRRRGALDDEVPRRPLRRGRRRAWSSATRSSPRRSAFHQFAVGRGVRPVRRLAHHARHQDPRRADGAALRQRAGDRGSSSIGHPAVERGLLPRPARATRATSSRPGRCAASAGCSRSRLAGGAAAAALAAPSRPSCSSSPSRSAAWSR